MNTEQGAAQTAMSGSRRTLTITICLVTAVLEGFDIQSMGVAAPKMAPALHLALGQMGWAFSASLFGLMFGAAIGGWFSDRIGRRPVLMASTLAFGLLTLATAFAPSLEVLLPLRFLAGLGLGGAMPMIVAIVSEAASQKTRIAAVTLASAGMPLGGMTVGILARSPMGQADWRLIFIVGGLLPLVVLIGQFFVLQETRRVSEASAAQSIGPSPLTQRTITMTLMLWLAAWCAALILHLMLNWLPTLLVQNGMKAGDAAGVLTLFNLGGVVGAILFGFTIDRVGARWPIAAIYAALFGVLTALAGAGLLSQISALATGAGMLAIGGQFCIFGVGSRFYPARTRGRGVGAMVSAGRFGSAIGPLVAGQLLVAGYGPSTVLGMVAWVALLCGAAAVSATFLGSVNDD